MNEVNIKATAIAFALEAKNKGESFEEVFRNAQVIYEWMIEYTKSSDNVIDMVRN